MDHEEMRSGIIPAATEGLADRVAEMKRDALKTGYPGMPYNRLNFITRLKPPSVIDHTLVEVEDKIWEAWIDGEEPDWDDIGGIRIKEEKLVSERGKGRNPELTGMAQWFPKEEPKGLLSKVRR